MKTLTLQFVSDASVTSRIIMLFSHGDYSHVDIVHGDSLIGARFIGGVRPRPMNYASWKKVKRVDIQLEDTAYDRAVDFLLAQNYKPYDWRSILAFAFDRDWRDDDSWFCSELAAAVCEEGGVFKFGLCNTNNKITPSDLLLALSAVTKVSGDE